MANSVAYFTSCTGRFAPRAERPDQVVNKRGSDVPLWALSSFFALLAICAYLGLKTHLTRGTQTTLAAYADLVKLAPRPANLTITLP